MKHNERIDANGGVRIPAGAAAGLIAQANANGDVSWVTQAAAGIGPAMPWDPAILCTVPPNTNTAAAAFTAINQGRAGRVLVQKTGHLHDLALAVGTASGNVSVGIYDVGATTPGTRTRLYTTGAIACPAAGLTVVGDPNLSVTLGQYLEFWVSVDNTTATFVRAALGSLDFPASYPAPVGSLSVNPIAPASTSAHPLPTTLIGGIHGGGILPLITAYVS